MRKRVLILSDFHCGHRYGLRMDDEWEFWRFFKYCIKKLSPIHVCICNGDLIEGKNTRWGGTELWTADRKEQKDEAVKILKFINAQKYVFTYGTPYHTGNEEDWEALIAYELDAEIKGQQYLNINNRYFHVKHKIPKSSIPHGRFTSLAKQKIWNLMWADRGLPKADIFIRSHVHYFCYCGDKDYFAVITPSLQAWGSKFGERECEGTIDWGILYIDINDKGEYSWNPILIEGGKVEVLKL